MVGLGVSMSLDGVADSRNRRRGRDGDRRAVFGGGGPETLGRRVRPLAAVCVHDRNRELLPAREVIVVTGSRAQALARLDVFVGEWVLEDRFPSDSPTAPNAAEGGPMAHSWFEWVLDRQFLLQRTEIPVPQAPDSLSIVSADPQTGAYTQHYYDSRGVVRLYMISLANGVWTLTRESPDFSPLDFRQRFTGTFSQDGNTISSAWEKCLDGGDWGHDFALTYRRAG